jgi:hypothetical protein
MDNNLARRERAALVASQAQTSSEIATLQAKVEEVCRAQFGQVNRPVSPSQLSVKCKRCMAATETVKWKADSKECSANTLDQGNQESLRGTNMFSSCDDLLTTLLNRHGKETGGGTTLEQVALDEEVGAEGAGRRERESGGAEAEAAAEAGEKEEDVQVNMLEAEIDYTDSVGVKAERNSGGGEQLNNHFSEDHPGSSPVLHRGRLPQMSALSLSAKGTSAGFGGGLEGFKRRSAFSASGVLLESYRKGVCKVVSSGDMDDQSICETGGESRADRLVQGRLSSGSRPDRTCSMGWLDLSHSADGATASENRPAPANSPKAESLAEQGPSWQKGWPGQLLGLLSPRSPKEPEPKVAGQQPVLPHKLPVLPRMQTPSPRMSATPRSSGHWAAIDDAESEVGPASVEHSASPGCSDASVGADWT